jgi:hypothetical protein
MKRFTTLAVPGLAGFSMLFSGLPAYSADYDNDLLSAVRAAEVYQAEESSVGTAGKAGRRITDLSELRRLLTDAGFESSDSPPRSVSVVKSLDDESYTVAVTISDDEFHLGVSVVLRDVKDRTSLSSEFLLNLLEAGLKNAPSQFVYHPDAARLELHHALKNQGVTGQMLRDEINRLAVQARETKHLWKDDAAATVTQTPPAASQTSPEGVAKPAEGNSTPSTSATTNSGAAANVPPAASSGTPVPDASSPAVGATPGTAAVPSEVAPQAAAPASPSTVSPAGPATERSSADQAVTVPKSSESQGLSQALTGRWSATRSTTEAFAVQFSPDGTFRLAYVNGTKKTTSTGRFTLNADRLTLTGTDGTSLAGTIISTSDAEFQFKPIQGAQKDSALTFRKAGT